MKRMYFLTFVFLMMGTSSLFAQTECIVVSGLSRDRNGAFNVAREALEKYKKCKIVSSWDEVKPISPAGSNIFIMQLSHGAAGGVAELDAGDIPPEKIYNKINDLSSNYKLGIYVESCFSGDLLGKFLTSPDHVQRNTCLMTTSALNRESNGGPQSLVNFLLTKDRSTTLSSVFQEHAKQGLISGASWESAGFTDLMFNASINLNLEHTINNLLSPSDDLKCNMLKTVTTGVKAICNGLSGKEVTTISSLLVSEEINKGSSAETKAIFDSKKFKKGTLKIISDMPFFSKNPNIKKFVSQCINTSTPVSCLTEKVLPEKCTLNNEAIKKDLAKALLGIHPDIKFGIFDNGMENDPTALLYQFSLFSLRNKSPMTINDQMRREACDSFHISW